MEKEAFAISNSEAMIVEVLYQPEESYPFGEAIVQHGSTLMRVQSHTALAPEGERIELDEVDILGIQHASFDDLQRILEQNGRLELDANSNKWSVEIDSECTGFLRKILEEIIFTAQKCTNVSRSSDGRECLSLAHPHPDDEIFPISDFFTQNFIFELGALIQLLKWKPSDWETNLGKNKTERAKHFNNKSQKSVGPINEKKLKRNELLKRLVNETKERNSSLSHNATLDIVLNKMKKMCSDTYSVNNLSGICPFAEKAGFHCDDNYDCKVQFGKRGIRQALPNQN